MTTDTTHLNYLPDRHTIAIALSRFYTTKAPLKGGNGHFLILLEEIAGISLKGDGQHPDAPSRPWARPSAETVLRQRGLSMDELRSAFNESRRNDGEEARLDDDLLLAFVPAPYWTVISMLISDGPSAAGRRIELAVAAHAKRIVKPTAARPEGGLISQGTIEARLKKVKRFLSVLVDLNNRLEVGGLEAWTAIPKIEVEDFNPREVTDTTAPDLTMLRRALSAMDRDAEQALGCAPEMQASRIRERTSPPRGMLLLLRQRVEVGLLSVVGMRIDALVRLTVDDIVESRPRPGSVAGSGPAVALRPEKTLGQNHIRYKPIPIGLLWRIQAYLAYVEAVIGNPLPKSNPLLVSNTKDFQKALGAEAIRERLGRSRSWKAKSKDGEIVIKSRPALLPRPDGKRGHSPHTLRGAAHQIIRSSMGAKWLRSHRDQWDDPRLPADEIALSMIADVLCDHEIKLDALGYGGGKKELDRERLAGYGTELTWALLTTDAGARKAPDVPRFRGTLIQRRAAEAELARIEQVTADTRRRLRTGEVPLDKGLFALEDLHDEERRVREQLGEIGEQLRSLRDPQRFLPLDDEEKLVSVDLDVIERNELGGNTDYDRRRHKPVRDWITPKELAQILDMGDASIRRWINGKFPRNLQPWDRDNPPIDATFGPKRKRLMVSGFNDGLFPSELAKEKLAETLARWPEGWSRAATEARA